MREPSSSTVPSIEHVLAAAWHVLARTWLRLLAVSLTCWLPVALLAIAWYQASGITLTFPDTGSGTLASPLQVASPRIALAGIPLLLLGYLAAVAIAAAATSRIAADTHEGTPTSYRRAMSWGLRRSLRTSCAYLALLIPAVALAIAALALASLAVYLALPAGDQAALTAGAVTLLIGGLAAIASWMLLYARWCLIGPAAALGQQSKRPWTQSARITKGRSRHVLTRVLAVTALAGIALSAPAAIFFLAHLGPAALAGTALALRVLTTIASAVLTGSATTPLYLDLHHPAGSSPLASAA